jgi:hypothetical protein
VDIVLSTMIVPAAAAARAVAFSPSGSASRWYATGARARRADQLTQHSVDVSAFVTSISTRGSSWMRPQALSSYERDLVLGIRR